MPYRVRAFCTGTNVPTLKQVFDYAKSNGITLTADEEHGPIDIDSTDWTEAEIKYKKNRSPLVIECNRDDGTGDCLAKVEPQEYIDEIGRPGLSFTKRRVINHLKNTKFIIASQLLSDIDDDGYQANGTFLKYFVDNCGGVIHADLEGFYRGDRVILKTG